MNSPRGSRRLAPYWYFWKAKPLSNLYEPSAWRDRRYDRLVGICVTYRYEPSGDGATSERIGSRSGSAGTGVALMSTPSAPYTRIDAGAPASVLSYEHGRYNLPLTSR
jgi:hypothetical protein